MSYQVNNSKIYLTYIPFTKHGNSDFLHHTYWGSWKKFIDLSKVISFYLCSSYYADLGPRVTKTLKVTNGGPFGNWGPRKLCPTGSLATAYRLKVCVLGIYRSLYGFSSQLIIFNWYTVQVHFSFYYPT